MFLKEGSNFNQNEEQISDQKFMRNYFISDGFIQSDVCNGIRE